MRDARVRPLGDVAVALGCLLVSVASCGAFGSKDVGAGPVDAGADGASADTPVASCGADLDVDPKNCGACGHDCAGAGCGGGRCNAEILASGQTNPTAIAADPTNVYWTNRSGSGSVMQCALGGCSAAPKPIATAQASPDYVVTSFWKGTPAVVWGTVDDSTLHAARPVDSPVAEPAITASGWSSLRAIATGNGFLFFAANDQIHRCTVDDFSSGCPFVTAGGTPQLGTIAVDERDSSVYWTTVDGIVSCGVDVGAAGAALFAGGTSFFGLGVGPTGVLVTQRTDPGGLLLTTRGAPDAGAATRPLDSGRHTPGGLAVDGFFAYYVAAGTGNKDGQLVRVGIQDSSALILADHLDAPSAVLVTGGFVYWTNSGTGQGAGSVMRVAK